MNPSRVREQTTLSALRRLLEKGASSSNDDLFAVSGVLSIHFLGVDEVEITSQSVAPSQLTRDYKELLQFVSLDPLAHQVRTLQLVFVGPNLEPALHNHRSSFVFNENLAVEVAADTRYYHEALQGALIPRPSLCLLFNAGLWGYDSWLPTLCLLLTPSSPSPLWVVVTSYTLQEAEDDFDTVQELAAQMALLAQQEGTPSSSSTAVLECVWDCEVNPAGGTERLDRPSAQEGREYYDSHYWSGFMVCGPRPT